MHAGHERKNRVRYVRSGVPNRIGSRIKWNAASHLQRIISRAITNSFPASELVFFRAMRESTPKRNEGCAIWQQPQMRTAVSYITFIQFARSTRGRILNATAIISVNYKKRKIWNFSRNQITRFDSVEKRTVRFRSPWSRYLTTHREEKVRMRDRERNVQTCDRRRTSHFFLCTPVISGEKKKRGKKKRRTTGHSAY